MTPAERATLERLARNWETMATLTTREHNTLVRCAGSLRAALDAPVEEAAPGPADEAKRLGYRMGIVDARHAAANATDWTDHMKRLDALISDSYAPGSQPPPPDYVLGQERMRERAAQAAHDAAGLGRDAFEAANAIRSLPLEAASEGARRPTKAWMLKTLLGQCDNERERSLVRDAYDSGSLHGGAAPAAQTTPGEKGTCRACGGYGWVGSVGGDPNIGPEPCPACSDPPAPPRDAGHNEGEKVCVDCRGTRMTRAYEEGEWRTINCPTCGGTGKLGGGP